MHSQHVITDEEHVKRQATSWDLASPRELFLSMNALVQCPYRSWTFSLNHPVREPQNKHMTLPLVVVFRSILLLGQRRITRVTDLQVHCIVQVLCDAAGG